MKSIVLWIMLIGNSFASCDLTEFRWECELRPQRMPSHAVKSLVYCANANLYLSQAQYDLLNRYQRANVNFMLNYKGNYIQGPCILADRG